MLSKLRCWLCIRQSIMKFYNFFCKLFVYKNSNNIISLSSSTFAKIQADMESNSLIKTAVKSLRSGQVIAVPTDTIYGIAGLAQNINAVQALYKIKRRDPAKPIAICVATIEDIPKWGKVTIPKELLSSLLPGPVTLVFERTNALNSNLNPDTSLVGIRIPDHDLLLSIVKTVGSPLALTSANVSSEQSSLDIKEFQHLWPQLDLIIDGGKLGESQKARLGSTIVDLSQVGWFRIIRQGSAYENTRNTLLKFNLKEQIDDI